MRTGVRKYIRMAHKLVVKNSYKTAILFLLVLQSCQNVNNQDENFPLAGASIPLV
jgi:hypothetical protein